jgi:hypothetical protein
MAVLVMAGDVAVVGGMAAFATIKAIPEKITGHKKAHIKWASSVIFIF